MRGAKVKSKSGRRPPVRVKAGPELPLLPIAVGGILIVLAIVLIIIAWNSAKHNTGTVASQTVDSIPCDNLEQTQVHYHTALQIVYGGIVHPIPANIGIVNPASPTCYYWMHVHPANTDTIHIESPKSRTFTLGQFFDIWTKWSGTPQPLDATHVSTFTLTPDQKLVIYIVHGDGQAPVLYTGDPRAIVLTKHEVITLEIAPPTVTPPPAFTFAAGL